MARQRNTKGEPNPQDDVVRFNVYLPRQAYRNLERIRQLSGKRSLAETIRSALNLYLVVQEELDDGKELFVQRKNGDDKEVLRLIAL